jgi:hypothetical protein
MRSSGRRGGGSMRMVRSVRVIVFLRAARGCAGAMGERSGVLRLVSAGERTVSGGGQSSGYRSLGHGFESPRGCTRVGALWTFIEGDVAA